MKYIKLHNVNEIKSVLKELLDNHKKYIVIAGGTDLMNDLKKFPSKFDGIEYMLDISEVDEIRGINMEDGFVKIGAATTIEEIRKHHGLKKLFPAIHDAAEHFATLQIRNMATIGGNLGTASPASSLAPPLLTYDAEIELLGPDGLRRLRLEQFFVGPKKNSLKPYEIILNIYIKQIPNSTSAYEEIGKRIGNIIPIVSSAAALTIKRSNENIIINEARIALGSVAPTPIRAFSAEKEITNITIYKSEILNYDMFREKFSNACNSVKRDILPIDDHRSSKWYRSEMAVTLTCRALRKALLRIWEQ